MKPTPEDTAQFSPAYTRILARALDMKREAMLPLLDRTGIEPDDIEFERLQLTPSQQYTVIANALTLSSEKALGLAVGEQAELSTHGLLGLASMSAATLYEVLEMFVKYQHVRAPFFDLQLETLGGDLVVKLKTLSALPSPVNQFLVEAGTSMMQSMVEHILGRELQEGRIFLPLGENAHWEIYRTYFHCPVSQTQDPFALYYMPLALAQSPSPNRDDVLRQRAEEGCRSILDRLAERNTCRGKVEELLGLNTGNYLSLADCARLLNVSARTLIRRLRAENTTFNEIIEHRRQNRAIQLLATPGISVEAISLELGYDHASNFRRAFKCWFGTTPSEYRQAHKTGV